MGPEPDEILNVRRKVEENKHAVGVRAQTRGVQESQSIGGERPKQ